MRYMLGFVRIFEQFAHGMTKYLNTIHNFCHYFVFSLDLFFLL